MTPNKPYLLRAIYEWLVDNDCTPFLLVNAERRGVLVPRQFVNREGQIILNLKPDAIRQLKIANYAISFSASFSGNVESIHIPMSAILALYAKENGEGMSFEEDPDDDDSEDGSETGKPFLQIIK
ncbi:MAG: ClpXP protease specificity-enhancing factor [Gammaproteobacteria bacterium GWF2_41_13]|nr:MAG: ClpXP protease specificity-enhancing factor [Gammaproteobacteria bacterium GWF2_41_13]